MRLKLLVAVIVFSTAAPAAAQPADVRYYCDTFSTDLPLAESKGPVHGIDLQCRLADGGACTLTLNPNVPKFDEFGELVEGGGRAPLVTLHCVLKLVKKDEARQLYEIRGPKVVSRLSLVALPFDSPQGDGRLLVHGKDGEVRYAISLAERTHRINPCHPGCFPAGTAVRVPDGTRPIERVREGDLVTTIDADGRPSPAKVVGVFVTRNRLLEVRAEGGTLVTTETQPVALEGGGFRPAGELKAGDRVWRWAGGGRRAVAVLGVSPAGREAPVFNLVLSEPTGFLAGDFLVRSKPPAAQAGPRAGAAGAVAPPHNGPR
jgi:hypothetical protein